VEALEVVTKSNRDTRRTGVRVSRRERSGDRGVPLRQAQGVVSLSNHASKRVRESEGRSPAE